MRDNIRQFRCHFLLDINHDVIQFGMKTTVRLDTQLNSNCIGPVQCQNNSNR